ncbi:hypothetical protein MMUR_58220 [Mycolicibacterium murale]|uniref:Uncharacterized protein n=1 Tax=Mycolicibacterium murale TaxID=182220 RepID=A0A7I9WWP0_9MYCO|nr:hypothetical protein MMUR_58220 [Mycolicibacterium murale]
MPAGAAALEVAGAGGCGAGCPHPASTVTAETPSASARTGPYYHSRRGQRLRRQMSVDITVAKVHHSGYGVTASSRR